MNPQKYLSLIIGPTLATFLLVACGGPQATQVLPAPETKVTSTPVSPTLTSLSPTPIRASPTATPISPALTSGSIRGVLVDSSTGKLLPGGQVFPILGTGKLEYNPTTDKFTGDWFIPMHLYEVVYEGIRIDKDGVFIISDIQPGSYFLAFRATQDGPIRKAFIARDQFELTAREGVDLGKILVPTK